MNKKTALKKQIAEAKQKLSRLRENKSEPKGVAFLIETEMEKYQLILSAKAIPDRLQDFAERIAKIEADDLMPVIDEYKKMFGKEAGERFHRETIGALRALMDQLQKTKDTVNSNIEALESGAPANDMATGAGLDDMGGDDLGTDDAMGGEEPAGDAGADPAAAAAAGADDGAEITPDGDMGAPEEKPAPEMEPGLGRALKESMKALRKSVDPDAVILEAFKTVMRSGQSAKNSARMVAEALKIDESDVRDIVKEAASTPRPFPNSSSETLSEMSEPAAKPPISKEVWKERADEEMKRRFMIDLDDAGCDDDDIERFYQMYLNGESISDFAVSYGEEYDLDDQTQGWGFNAGSQPKVYND